VPTLTHDEAVKLGRRGGRRTQASRTPDERREAMRKARLALAVRELVDQAPELTEEQRARLRTLLQPPEHQDQAAATA
jgi:hypothetical protein